MLFVYVLAISLIVLLVFSLSREKGKNTKFARKEANSVGQKRQSSQSIDTSSTIEIN